MPSRMSVKKACMSCSSLHFSSPDGRSTRYDRQDFVRLLAVLNVLFKYACVRQAARAFFLRPACA